MKRRSDEERLEEMLQKFKESEARRKAKAAEKGKARSQRYRQSSHGKAKLREKYEERKKVLAAEFAKFGCRVCGMRDGEVLRAVPKKGKKLKFAPTSMNASRSLRSWRELLGRADILCLNCLGKRSLAAMADELPENSTQFDASGTIKPEESRIRENSPFPEGVKIKAPQKAAAATCACCGREFRKKWAWQKCCSRTCQLIYLAARTFQGAYERGQASGLQGIVAELAGVKR
jgi:hypothetical protein